MAPPLDADAGLAFADADLVVFVVDLAFVAAAFAAVCTK